MLPKTIEELEAVRKDCLRLSRKRAFLSAAVAVVPVPLADIATDMVLLKQIIPAVSEKFGLSKEQLDEYNPQIAILIYDIAKKLGTNMVGKYVTEKLIAQILKKMGVRLATRQFSKYVPIIGQALTAGISFAGMKLIINSHIRDCYEVARKCIEAKDTEVAR